MMRWINRHDRRVDATAVGIMVVVLLAGSSFFYRLGAKSIWLDESFTYADSQLDVPRIIEGPRASFNIPPAWFLLTRASLAAFGDTDASLRLVPALFAFLAVAAFAWCAARLFDRKTGLVASLLLAASPMMLHHAQEARPYSAQLLFNILSTGALWNLLHGTRRARLPAWILYTLSTVVGFHLSYMSTLVLVPHLALVLIWAHSRLDEESSRVSLLVVSSLLVAAIACLPRLGDFLAALDPGLQGSPPVGPGLPTFGSELADRSSHNAGSLVNAFWWAHLYGSRAAAVVSSALVGAALLLDGRRRERRLPIVWCLALIVGPVAALLFMDRTTWSRYFIVALPWFLLLVARGSTAAGDLAFRAAASRGAPVGPGARRLAGSAVLVALVVAHAPAWASYHRGQSGYSRNKVDWKASARHIEENWRPGELIIAADLHAYLCLGRYLPAILPRSFDEMLAMLETAGRGYVVDGGWRPPSDQLTIRHDLEARPEARLALTPSHVRLYEWGPAPAPAAFDLDIDLGGRTREMFLDGGWSPGRYRLPDGRLAGIIDDGSATLRFIRPHDADGPFRLTMEILPFLKGRSDLTLTLNGSPFLGRDLTGTEVSIEATLPDELLEAGSNLLGIRHESADRPAAAPPVRDMLGVPWPVDVAAHGIGGSRGDAAWIFVDGRRYSWEDARRGPERGYTVMVLDGGGRIEAWESFDTCCSPDGPAPSARMAAFLDAVPEGRIVVAITRLQAGGSLTDAAVAALRRIGAAADPREHPTWVHAVIGIKGLAPGAAAEEIGPDEVRVVVGTDPEADMLLVRRVRINQPGAPDPPSGREAPPQR